MMISLIWYFPLVFNQTLHLAIICLLYDFLGITWIKDLYSLVLKYLL